jgi:hypothetical protein
LHAAARDGTWTLTVTNVMAAIEAGDFNRLALTGAGRREHGVSILPGNGDGTSGASRQVDAFRLFAITGDFNATLTAISSAGEPEIRASRKRRLHSHTGLVSAGESRPGPLLAFISGAAARRVSAISTTTATDSSDRDRDIQIPEQRGAALQSRQIVRLNSTMSRTRSRRQRARLSTVIA